jgi:hypothetical protein
MGSYMMNTKACPPDKNGKGFWEGKKVVELGSGIVRTSLFVFLKEKVPSI